MAETESKLIDIYIMGERHRVPDSLTILQAFEYAGYKLVRGVGCRGGFCGACATVYRLPGDFHLKFALACQTRVEPDMQLAMIPFYPANRSTFEIFFIYPGFQAVQMHRFAHLLWRARFRFPARALSFAPPTISMPSMHSSCMPRTTFLSRSPAPAWQRRWRGSEPYRPMKLARPSRGRVPP